MTDITDEFAAAKAKFEAWVPSAKAYREGEIAERLAILMSSAMEPVERLVDWLILGVGAVASVWIVQSGELLNLLAPTGYVVAGMLLASSFLLGFLNRAGFRGGCLV